VLTKAPDAFRTISEVAEDLELPQHVLRFWETKFAQIKPMKRGGGRRYYRPDDIDLLRGIKYLLYDEGYTIRGLQRIFREQGNRFVSDVGRGDFDPAAVASDDPADREPKAREAGLQRGSSGKRAVAVGELTKQKGGLLTKLRGRAGEDGAADGQDGLSSLERRNLKGTLQELLECKRLLDQVRGS
jgi:DNA-binding transcriptional MerR regulator